MITIIQSKICHDEVREFRAEPFAMSMAEHHNNWFFPGKSKDYTPSPFNLRNQRLIFLNGITPRSNWKLIRKNKWSQTEEALACQKILPVMVAP